MTSSLYATARDTAYNNIMDAEKNIQNMRRTKMCNSVKMGIPCKYGSKCNFAHSVDELTIPNCFFGTCCRFVCHETNNTYSNTNDKICKFLHPGETKQTYNIRCGLVKKPPVVPKPKLARRETYVDDLPKHRTITVPKELALETVQLLNESGIESYTLKVGH